MGGLALVPQVILWERSSAMTLSLCIPNRLIAPFLCQPLGCTSSSAISLVSILKPDLRATDLSTNYLWTHSGLYHRYP